MLRMLPLPLIFAAFSIRMLYNGRHPIVLAAFWVLVLTSVGLPLLWESRIRGMRIARSFLFSGAAMNATVVMANGGMPVLHPYHSLPNGIWIPVSEHTRLLFLGGIHFGGFSVGDMFILVGLLAGASIALFNANRGQTP